MTATLNCLGAFRTSLCSNLSTEANEAPLNLRWQKLSLQYLCLKTKLQLPEPCLQHRL